MQDTGVESLVNNVCKEMAVSSSRQLTDRRAKPNHPAQTLKCPRCDSLNTKFCYYNNYNLSQPRHFCKNCRRYWTKGGALRNVPVGGGCRKNKRSNKQKNSGDQHPHRNNLAGKSAPKPDSSADKCGGANSSSSSLVNNLQDGSDKSASIGFDSECNTTTTTNNNNNGTGSGSLSSGQQHQVFNTDLHQVQLLNSGNSLSSISYENPQFSIDPGVIGGSLSWSLADMQWKQQQSLTSLLTDGRSFDGSTITEPPPLLEDITSLGEAAISRFIKTTPALSWPSLLQDEDSGNNINKDNNNNSNNHHHAFDWQTNSSSNSEAFLEIQSDLGPWGGGNWPDLGNYGPGTSLP